jgi:hypothetical protein
MEIELYPREKREFEETLLLTEGRQKFKLTHGMFAKYVNRKHNLAAPVVGAKARRP